MKPIYDYNTIKMRQTGSKLVLMAGKLPNCQHCGNINYFPCLIMPRSRCPVMWPRKKIHKTLFNIQFQSVHGKMSDLQQVFFQSRVYIEEMHVNLWLLFSLHQIILVMNKNW